ncbi:MAG: crotonobetainyl-CoA:carnitine CoA-transferase CaiB-like acyl-CoA transferase [Candidatus Poriferisodalaceae bacterium]|jgi:crotonobetainyl-CoA:carnitine CoA-transferase CaiB-like acyl-CoA transferase
MVIMVEQAQSELPLSDLVVLDLTIARAGPTAVRQLADWGANVIRVEQPGAGGFAGGTHLTPDYLNLHRNKRSIAVDLKNEEGRQLLHRMVETADVLVENMRVDVKHRLGFDYETLSAINPRLVMGSISGFGQTGPYSKRGGVDQIAQGMGGMMQVTGNPGQGPVRAGVAISDVTAGLQLAVGIMVAIHERTTTGKGRWVHTSLLESMIGMLDFQAARWTVAGDDPPQAGNDHPTFIPMGMYETSDGFINIAASGGRLWTAFCEEIGRPELLTDERFVSGRGRSERRDELNAIITTALSAASAIEWVERLNAVGVPSGPVNTVKEAFADPQVLHLGIAAPMSHAVAGETRVIRNATNLEGVDNGIRIPTPAQGEHTDEILAEFGLDEDQVRSLRDSGAVS